MAFSRTSSSTASLEKELTLTTTTSRPGPTPIQTQARAGSQSSKASSAKSTASGIWSRSKSFIAERPVDETKQQRVQRKLRERELYSWRSPALLNTLFKA